MRKRFPDRLFTPRPRWETILPWAVDAFCLGFLLGALAVALAR